jgi:hypothetical protein
MVMYKEMPFTAWEEDKIAKMVANGTSLEGAIKTRYALRKKKRVLQVKPPKSVTIQA